jgi:hypothetical protein
MGIICADYDVVPVHVTNGTRLNRECRAAAAALGDASILTGANRANFVSFASTSRVGP